MQPGLDFRLRAQVDGFEAEIRGASAVVQRELGGMNAAARRFDGAMAGVATTFGGKFTGVIQQAGFQIGDFATQVASGGNPLVALTQQGTQFISMFGPWGAVLGAAGAVAGALATYLLAAGDASESAGEEMSRLALSTGELDGAMRALEGAAVAYADAISATAGAQSSASDSIVADTKREFEAKKALLELEVARQQALQAERQAAIAGKSAELNAPLQLFDTEGMGPDAARIYGRDNQNEIERYRERVAALAPELKRLRAEATLAEIAIEKANTALATPFRELAAGAADRKAGRAGGGGGAAEPKTPFDDILDKADERIGQIDREAAAVGLSAEAAARAALAYEAERLELELLTAAREQHGAAADRVAPVIEAYVQHYRDAAGALLDARAAQEQMAQSQREAAAAAQAQSRAIEQVGDAITGAITQADSFSDALRNVALQLLNIGLQGLAGSGPLGAIINSALGVTSGGLGSYLGGANSAAAPATAPLPSFRRAGGGRVTAGTPYLVGEHGPEPFIPSVDGRVLSRAQAAAPGGARGVVMNFDLRGQTDPLAAAATFRRAVAGDVRGIVQDMRRRGEV